MNLSGEIGVCYEYMDGGDGADEGGADLAHLSGVCDDDDLLGVANHGEGDGGLFGLERGDSSLEIEACDSDEGLVEVDVAEEVESRLAGEGEGPGPGESSSGEHGLDGGLIAEFHADVDGVGDDGDAVAMTERTANLRGGGTGGESDGLLLTDELAGGDTDTTLLVGGAEFAGLEGSVVAVGFVEERLEEGGTAVGAEDETSFFKAGEIAANAGSRGAYLVHELLNGDIPGSEQGLHNAVGAYVSFGRHRMIRIQPECSPRMGGNRQATDNYFSCSILKCTLK